MTSISGSRRLHCLIYCSRRKINSAHLDHEISEVVRSSIRNNREAAITGLLLVHEGWFLQALEGPYEPVINTYNRFLSDPRHEANRVLSAAPAERRSFGDWNMCARRIGPADDTILDALQCRRTFAPATFSAASALRLLKAVRGIQARTEVSALS